MRNTIFKALIFIMILAVMIGVNLYAFRSEVPSTVIITFVGSVALLIYFPYKTFFNIKEL